jgi:hypothetical protein
MRSLGNRIWDAKKEQPHTKHIDQIMPHILTDNQIDMVVSMIGYRCRQDTKAQLKSRLSLPLALIKNHGIYDRLLIGDRSIEYVCGQSWDDEMRTLRQCLLKYYV